jgi:CubicO group peptidase (beta-lactamase class C family)
MNVASKDQFAGVSQSRLSRLDAVLNADVDAGRIPGAVVAIYHRGELVHEKACGFRHRAANAAMRTSDIFRIASMTKPVTSLAAMMLAEEGKLLIPDPVANYLPELAGVQVGVERNGQLELVAPERLMTVHDLLRHTAGLTYGLFGQSQVKTAYNEAQVFNLTITNEEMSQRIAKLPLAAQPGTLWEYSMATDVLGRVVEVVSGESLGDFFQRHIFSPLGMHDSGFLLPSDKAARMAQPQADLVLGQAIPMADHTLPWAWESGGAGLYSTAQDYLRFCRMLLNGGELDGVRLVAPSTIALMTSDHIDDTVGYADITRTLFEAEAPTREMGQSFGLGFAIRTHAGRNPLPGTIGDYYWAGALGTYFWIDPHNELIAIFMSQAPADRLHYRYVMRQCVYQALSGWQNFSPHSANATQQKSGSHDK